MIALAGPNGAGKSTAGPALLRGALRVSEFVNADLIAEGLSAFAPQGAAIQAGKAMRLRMADLSRRKSSFAFETTLAARSYAQWIPRLISEGYSFHIVFLWLPSPEFALGRVADRVRAGGHAVPEETVRRRYHAGLRNFFGIYRRLATTWKVFDSSRPSPELLAAGCRERIERVDGPEVWEGIVKEYGHAGER